MVVLRKDDMIKKIAIIIFLMLAAHCAGRPQGAAPTILPGLAFAAVSDDTLCLQCPAEEYLTIETWYPSPWNAYDELRSNRIVVGGGDAEKDPLPPPWGTIAFKPLSSAPANSSDGTVSKGTMYFDDNSSKFKYSPDGSAWENLGGGEIKLAQYDFSTSKPACNSGNTGLMVFDSGSNRPYVCDNSGKWLTSSWTDKDLVMAVHSSTQCTSAGWTVVDDGTGNKFCKITSGSCPGGWMQYSQWSTTQNSQCWNCDGLHSCCGGGNDNSGSHSWANSPVENAAYTWRGWKSGNPCASETRYCQAGITDIGCY